MERMARDGGLGAATPRGHRTGEGAKEILVDSTELEKRDVLQAIVLLAFPFSLGCNGLDCNTPLTCSHESSYEANALFDSLAMNRDQRE